MRAWQVPALAQAQCEGHHRIKLSHNPEQWCSFSNAKGIMLLMPDAQFSQSTTTGGGGGQMLVPATGSTQWTYLDGTGAEHGPFAVAQLQEWYRAGQLTMDRKLRPAGGAGGFLPLSSIAELVSQLQSGQQPTVRVEQQSVAPKRDSRGGSGGFSGVYIVLEPATVRAGCNINSVALGDLSPGTQVYPPTTTPSPPNSLLLVASILFVV
jgi:hypothetical protein